MKKILTLFVALIAAISVSAQNYAGSSKFSDNWSVGVEGGVQTNLKAWNQPQGAVAGININKQISPLFGLTAEGLVGINNVRNWSDVASHFCNGVAIDQLNIFGDGRLNLTNALFGYKGKPRFLEIEALGGIGYGHTYVASATGTDDVLTKAGLNINFNLFKNRALTLAVKPAVIWSIKDRHFDVHNGVAQLTAGLVWHFGTSNGKRYIEKIDVNQIIADNESLNTEIAYLKDELAKKPNEVIVHEAAAPQPVATNAVAEVVEKTAIVFFAKNSSVLTDEAKETLDNVKAQFVKIVATASPEGAQKYNQALSEKRAAVVADYLTKKGVKVSSYEGLGSTGKASNRVAIVTVEQ